MSLRVAVTDQAARERMAEQLLDRPPCPCHRGNGHPGWGARGPDRDLADHWHRWIDHAYTLVDDAGRKVYVAEPYGIDQEGSTTWPSWPRAAGTSGSTRTTPVTFRARRSRSSSATWTVVGG